MNLKSSVVFSLFAKINFKIIVVGDKDVGKTALVLKYVKDTFNKAHNNSQGIQFYSTAVDIGGDQIALQLWDTAGSSQFRSITKSFYQQACCVVIAYSDPSKVRSTIESYLLQINEFSREAVQIVIARTKIDLVPLDPEQQKVLEEFEKKIDNILFWTTVCAKTGENVGNFFLTTAKALFSKYHDDSHFKELVQPIKDSFMLSPRMIPKEKSKGCCS